MADRKTIWESALIPGLAVAAVPVAYTLLCRGALSLGIDGTGKALLVSGAVMLLWAAKIFGGIWLFRLFLLRFAIENGCDGRDVFRFGLAVSFLSSLIFAGFNMAYMTYLAPDLFQNLYDSMVNLFGDNQQYTALLDQIKAAPDPDPKATFVSNLLYGFCFGTVLSSIFSKKIK